MTSHQRACWEVILQRTRSEPYLCCQLFPETRGPGDKSTVTFMLKPQDVVVVSVTLIPAR